MTDGTMAAAGIQVRPCRDADLPFLGEMFYEAAFWQPEVPLNLQR